MNTLTIGVVDYGMGNHASVVHCMRELGFRVRVSKIPSELDHMDVLILPGVGAFPMAMRALRERGLDAYLREQGRNQRPIIGICLGMQLLAGASSEYGYTKGLDLIPGEFVPFQGGAWHIGWNDIACAPSDSLLAPSDKACFYFNHSFLFQGEVRYQAATTLHGQQFASIIRNGSTIGLQFHPEKSQKAGHALLHNLITGMPHA